MSLEDMEIRGRLCQPSFDQGGAADDIVGPLDPGRIVRARRFRAKQRHGGASRLDPIEIVPLPQQFDGAAIRLELQSLQRRRERK